MFVTNLDLPTVLDLARVAFFLQEQNIRYYNIGPQHVTPGRRRGAGTFSCPGGRR